MRQKIEQFLDEANPASRCLLAVCASTPFYGVYMLINWLGLTNPVVRQGVRVPVVMGLQWALVFATVLSVGLGLWLWPRRREPGPMPLMSVVVTLNIGVVYTLISLASGLVTSAANITVMGVLAIGLFLFDMRTMTITYLLCWCLIVIYDGLVVSGRMPYAPAITSWAFEGHEPQWWWAVWRNVVFYSATMVISTFLLVMYGRMDALHRKLNKLSYTDVLTGLANRRSFMERLEAEVARQKVTQQPLSLLILDADHFKQVNDTHGHAAGDQVLKVLAGLLGESLRIPTDLAARLGGEEFAILLPHTALQDAKAVCARIHERLAGHVFEEEGQTFQVTVSIGLAECHGYSAEQVLRLADRNLYRAKQEGRNRSIFSVDTDVGGL